MTNMIAGKRFLIAEDDQLIAILLTALLTEQGAEICDRATTLAEAEHMIAQNHYDAALFDVKLGKDESFPAAETAQRKGIPVLFTSGYANFDRPATLADAPLLAKPYLVADAVEKISALFETPTPA